MKTSEAQRLISICPSEPSFLSNYHLAAITAIVPFTIGLKRTKEVFDYFARSFELMSNVGDVFASCLQRACLKMLIFCQLRAAWLFGGRKKSKDVN